jgi:hypothetical protein
MFFILKIFSLNCDGVCGKFSPGILLSVCFTLLPFVGIANGHSNQKPVLLILFLEASDYSEIEISLQKKLALSIESHRITIENDFQFTKTTVPERINEIRKLDQAQNCEAAIWITPIRDHVVSLQMAVLAPGQFTIRSVEANVENNEIGELTIAVREMLADIRISVETQPAIQPPQEKNQRKTVTGVPLQPPAAQSPATQSPTAQSPIASPAYNYFFSVDTGVESGFQHTTAPPILLTGAFGLGLSHASGVRLASVISIFGALPFEPTDSTITTYGVRPGAQLSYIRRKKFLWLGPFLGVSAPYQIARISMDDAFLQKVKWWNCAFEPGLLLLFPVGKSIQIQIRSFADIYVKQTMFKRRSDESTFYAPPRFTGSIAVGVNFMLQ